MITFSIVSHHQGDLINDLFNDLDKIDYLDFDVILTVNVREDLEYSKNRKFKIHIIINESIKGFGSNHNFAFSFCNRKIFCVVNPDIRIGGSDISGIFNLVHENRCGVVAPLVKSPSGCIDQSARKFPTFTSLFKKLISNPMPDYAIAQNSGFFYPDWVGGMFMVFRSDFFAELNGFDEKRFFMYYEDVDICRRIKIKNKLVVINTSCYVVHIGQRKSHFNLKHFFWHFKSLCRFILNI